MTYHPDEKTERHEFNAKSVPLLSFPWVVADHLCIARRRNMSLMVRSNIRSYLDWLTQSTLEIFSSELNSVLETSAMHEKCLLEVQDQVGSYGTVHLSSASALLLFQGQVDLTVLIIPNEGSTSEKNEQIRVLEQCQRLLRVAAKSATISAEPLDPILEMMYNSNCSSTSVELDVVANPKGLDQFTLLRQYIVSYPWMLPALRLILKWGRGTGVFAQRKYSLLPTMSLALLCIHVAIEEGYVDPILTTLQDIDLRWLDFCSSIPNKPEEFCSACIGPYLVSLFSRPMQADNLDVHPSLQDAVGHVNFTEIGVQEGWSIFAEQVEIAGHALMLNGNASVLLSKSMTEKAFFLTKQAARGVASSVKQHMRWLRNVSGADVATGGTQNTSKFGLVVRAFGTYPYHPSRSWVCGYFKFHLSFLWFLHQEQVDRFSRWTKLSRNWKLKEIP